MQKEFEMIMIKKKT